MCLGTPLTKETHFPRQHRNNTFIAFKKALVTFEKNGNLNVMLLVTSNSTIYFFSQI